MADARNRSTPSDREHLTKLEEALFEIRRVIAGQEEMLERLLLCLLSGGHLLIEGVPGLAKTLAIKSTASVLGGTFSRIQFTPDLVPSDLVGTRSGVNCTRWNVPPSTAAVVLIVRVFASPGTPSISR